MVAKKDVAFFCYAVPSRLRVVTTMLASVWIVAKWLMLQIIMMISIFHITKNIVLFLCVTIATFGILFEEIETGFCHLTKVLKRQQKLLEGKKRKIFYFFFFCVSTQTKFSFFDQVKTFLLNYSKWWWTDISTGIRLIS